MILISVFTSQTTFFYSDVLIFVDFVLASGVLIICTDSVEERVEG
jgi:hypothetical protein